MESNYKMVTVHWKDACSGLGWTTLEAAIENMTLADIESVGWLIYEGPDRIMLSTSVDPQGKVADVLSIPNTWIINIKEVNYVEGLDGRRSKEGC